MTALTSTMAQQPDNSAVPNFEGIDPPLLDPSLVEQFQAGTSRPTTLQDMPLEELIKLVAQICESDPSFSEQIIAALQPEQQEQPEPPAPVVEQQQVITPATTTAALGADTNALLRTLNQSLLLQDINTSLALQLANGNGGTTATKIVPAPVTTAALFTPEHQTMEQAMKSNLFVMENKGSNFIPIRDFKKPGPKYTRKNFSPDQIEGLEAAFSEHRFVKKDLRRELARKLNLSERSISYWFQNKRARSKPPITMSSEAARSATSHKDGDSSPLGSFPLAT